MQNPEIKRLESPVEFSETPLQRDARRRRYVMVFLFFGVLLGAGALLFRGCLTGNTNAASPAISFATKSVETPVKTSTPFKVVVTVVATVLVERQITAIPTLTPIPTQTPHIIYRSVVQPTYTPFPTWTPSPMLNGVYWDNGCLVVNVWNVREIYVNDLPAVGGQRYCDVKTFRMVVQ